MKKRWQFLLGAMVVLGIGGLAFARLRPYSFHGTVIQSPQPAPGFELQGSNGQRIGLEDYRGKLVLLFFGYTYCPDVCPTTLAELAQAMKLLGPKAEQVQVIMISLDPERDTPERLAQYVAHFSPAFLGATGTGDEIAVVATLYGIFFAKGEGTRATGYSVDHTASVMVIDETGHLKLVFPYGTPAEDIADDLDYLLR